MDSESPAWLRRLRVDMAEISCKAAQGHWPGPNPAALPYFNYRLEHIRQVERDALRLLKEVSGDRDIVLAAVWIHDRFQPQYDGEEHAARAAAWARINLISLGFPVDKVETVCHAVAVHSNPPQTIPAESREARLLWDADKLSKIGAVSVLAYLCAHPAFPGRPVTFRSMAQRGLAGLEKARARVEDYYFSVTKRWAFERYVTQKDFYEALAREAGVGRRLDAARDHRGYPR